MAEAASTPAGAVPAPDGAEHSAGVQEFTLDMARETMYVAARSSERHGAALKKVAETLDGLKEDDAWLEQVQLEATKAISFHEQQKRTWESSLDALNQYIDAVKALAEELATLELSADGANDSERRAAVMLKHTKAKSIHPELLKFKLEKQARILGKIGGVPALGPGVALPRAPRDSILKATASPAAREIHYGKMEDKDAQYLATVMRFKAKQQEAELSPWQKEAKERGVKGVQDEEEASSTSLLRAGSPHSAELAAVLLKRQEASASAAASEASAKAAQRRSSAGSSGGGFMTPELAAKLHKRQSALEKQEGAGGLEPS